MKRVLWVSALTLVISTCLSGVSASSRPSATTVSRSAIVFQNVGTATAHPSLDIYLQGSNIPITTSLSDLWAGASSSIAIQSILGTDPIDGASFELSSDQPVVALVVQYATDAPYHQNWYSAVGPSGFLMPTVTVLTPNPVWLAFVPSGRTTTSAPSMRRAAVALLPPDAARVQYRLSSRPRVLSNSRLFIPAVLKHMSNATTIFEVWNPTPSAVDLTISFYAAGVATPLHTLTVGNLPGYTSKAFNADQIAGLGFAFDGSAVVEAHIAGTSTNVLASAAVTELSHVGRDSLGFEATAGSGARVYMISALCQATAAHLTSLYDVQNATDVDVTFQVRYQWAGKPDVLAGPFIVSPFAKQRIDACATLPSNTVGSAIIERMGTSGALVALTRIVGDGVHGAFLGASTGASRVALPFIRWSNDTNYTTGRRQRTVISIQNVGTSAATAVQMEYIDRSGNVLATHQLGSLAPGATTTSDPQSAGALDACGRFGEYGGGADCLGTMFGGGAILTSANAGQLIAEVRVTSSGASPSGEDYRGIETN
jgi:hypothetical protein